MESSSLLRPLPTRHEEMGPVEAQLGAPSRTTGILDAPLAPSGSWCVSQSQPQVVQQQRGGSACSVGSSPLRLGGDGNN